MMVQSRVDSRRQIAELLCNLHLVTARIRCDVKVFPSKDSVEIPQVQIYSYKASD